MISLAAWITVSMSALSKLSTMKRPRCADGTGGGVGGAPGGGGGGAAPGACATGGRRADGGGGSGAGASTRGGLAVAQLLRKAARTTVATPRFSLLLWGIALRGLWETAQKIRPAGG